MAWEELTLYTCTLALWAPRILPSSVDTNWWLSQTEPAMTAYGRSGLCFSACIPLYKPLLAPYVSAVYVD